MLQTPQKPRPLPLPLCASPYSSGRTDGQSTLSQAGSPGPGGCQTPQRKTVAREPAPWLPRRSAPWLIREYGFRVVGSAQEVTSGDELFPCPTLGVTKMRACICVARQLQGDGQTSDTWRGQASRYPSCVSSRCADGRAIRSTLGDPEGGQRPRTGMRLEQSMARARLAARGLLDDVPTIDALTTGEP